MELHDRPFRVIFIDALGPISPRREEAEFIFHAEDPFSRWVWLHCSPADTAEEWARFLVEDVFFDLCGFPAVLRSDRGSAFTSQVIASVNQLLGITHAFGAAFRLPTYAIRIFGPLCYPLPVQGLVQALSGGPRSRVWA